jgi:hypothetical protein
MKMGMKISWRKALGKYLKGVEDKCIGYQQYSELNPTVLIMSLDTFNESLIQGFSLKNPRLKSEYLRIATLNKNNLHPDYGQWLHHKNLLGNELPNHISWFREVHGIRIHADLAHAKNKKTDKSTKPIPYEKAFKLRRRAKIAWAELISSWKAII